MDRVLPFCLPNVSTYPYRTYIDPKVGIEEPSLRPRHLPDSYMGPLGYCLKPGPRPPIARNHQVLTFLCSLLDSLPLRVSTFQEPRTQRVKLECQCGIRAERPCMAWCFDLHDGTLTGPFEESASACQLTKRRDSSEHRDTILCMRIYIYIYIYLFIYLFIYLRNYPPCPSHLPFSSLKTNLAVAASTF